MEENEKKEEMNKQTDNAANGQSMNQTYGFAPDAKLKECKHCRVMIPKKAKICPNCKMRVKMGWLKKLLLILFLLVIIGAAVCGAGYDVICVCSSLRNVPVYSSTDSIYAAEELRMPHSVME